MTIDLIRAAIARRSAGRLDEAVALVELAASRDASLSEALATLLHDRGNFRLGKGDLSGALADFGRAADLSPIDAWSVFNIGVIQERLGRPGEAERKYREALERDSVLWPAWNNLMLIFRRSGRLADACRAGRIAHALHPDFYEVLVNLGDTFTVAGRIDDSIRSLRRALGEKAEPGEALSCCGLALGLAGNIGAGLTALRRSATLNPGGRDVWNNLATVIPSGSEVIVSLQRAHALAPDDASIHSNLIFALTYVADGDDRRPQTEAVRWGARHAPLIAAPSFANRRDPERRLRVAYLSVDFRSHPIAFSIEALFCGHDRSEVEVIAYSATPIRDAVSARLAGTVDAWRDVAGHSSVAIADRLRADEIDVLVVVAGHAGSNPLKVAAFRPAPVQVSLYDVVTSGVDAVDAWVTDAVLHPAGTTEPFVEALVRVPCLHLHLPPEDAPPPRRDGAEGVVFGSLGNPIKLSPLILDAWRQVLDSVPGSTLLLKYKNRFADPVVQAPIRAMLGDRVRFLGGDVGRSDHLALWNQVDIALDSYPFNGSTTTFEALWMGVPVVTLAGNRFVSRICADFLERVGLGDLVAGDVDGYVERAAALARDRARLMDLRRDLRSRVAASAICDARANARSLEIVYRDLWRAWCNRP